MTWTENAPVLCGPRAKRGGRGQLGHDDVDQSLELVALHLSKGILPCATAGARCMAKLQIANFRKTTNVARLTHRGRQPGRDDGPGLLLTEKRRAQRQDVRSIVLTRVTRDRL